jgi:hypothetical protein
MQEIPKSVQKTVDVISAELRLLPNLEEVTRGTSVLLPSATKMEKEDAVSIWSKVLTNIVRISAE